MSNVNAHSVVDLIADFIEQHYRDPISLRDVAAAIGYTSAYATTAFRRATGTPVTSWINRHRITAAQRLFTEQNVDVAAACEAVGFNDVRHFTRQFRRYAGTTPGAFRARIRHGKQRA